MKMKKQLYIILLISTMTFFVQSLMADEPPNPGGGPGSGDLPVGGASPLGEGLLFLAGLASLYLGKSFIFRKKKPED